MNDLKLNKQRIENNLMKMQKDFGDYKKIERARK